MTELGREREERAGGIQEGAAEHRVGQQGEGVHGEEQQGTGKCKIGQHFGTIE